MQITRASNKLKCLVGSIVLCCSASTLTIAAQSSAPGNEPTNSHKTLTIDTAEPSALSLLGTEVLPGTATRLFWSAGQYFETINMPTPVLVAHGKYSGPVLCLTAAIHGDELNGIEIVRRVLHTTDPQTLSGTLIGVPIVNLDGFYSHSRYLTGRTDLNRFFPGNVAGNTAERVAHSLFSEIISHCDALVDLHSGSFYRTNLPQLRADLHNKAVVHLAEGFGSTIVLHSTEEAPGALRHAAVKAGIPAVTMEAGQAMTFNETFINYGSERINHLLHHLDMLEGTQLSPQEQPTYYGCSFWVRPDTAGILFGQVALGDHVKANDILGTVTDPVSNVSTAIVAPMDGQILGMAINQVVMPGFPIFRIGIKGSYTEGVINCTQWSSSSF